MINNNKALEEESQQVPIPEQYIINKPLRLETVNQGSNEDDVLVRGNDNTVKYVSQSELGGNGIESVTGNVVDNSVFNNPIINLKTINNQNLSGSGNINITNSVPPIQQVLLAGSRVDDRGLEFHEASNRYTTYIASGGVTVVDHVENKGIGFEGGDQIFARNLALGGVNVLDLAINSGEIVFYNLAPKPTGTYTLATTSDIITYSPVSDSIAGIVDNTALQELGGVDKLINGIRIGKGGGNISSNLVLGSDSLLSNSTGNYSTAICYKSLYTNTIGAYNTSVGSLSLNYNTTGLVNTSVGAYASQANTTGSYNTVVGGSALSANQFGSSNVAIGASALRNNVGVSGSNIYGHRSIAIGGNAMLNNTTGNGIAIGDTSLKSQTTGTYNIAIGLQAGSGITTGNTNVIIADTGFVTAGGGITTGSNNMIIAPNNGNTTGITTGSGNIVLGKVTGLSASASNTITISDGVGNIAITKSTIGELKTPNLTQALIVSGGTSSLVNKGYVDNTTAVDNATTTNLSSATLTSTYPNALSGFRVRCLNIASGALTYEKTTTGWIQYTITITQ